MDVQKLHAMDTLLVHTVLKLAMTIKHVKNLNVASTAEETIQAYSRVCPKWTFEKEIQAVKLTNNVTYPEALRLIESRIPSEGISSSNIVKSNEKSCDASTLTSPTIILSSHPKKTTYSFGNRC